MLPDPIFGRFRFTIGTRITQSHEMGDLALRGFASTPKRTIRTSDIGVRTGGDEFLVLVPHGGLDGARIIAERVREAVELAGRSEPHTAITVSAGVAAWRAGRNAERVLAHGGGEGDAPDSS